MDAPISSQPQSASRAKFIVGGLLIVVAIIYSTFYVVTFFPADGNSVRSVWGKKFARINSSI